MKKKNPFVIFFLFIVISAISCRFHGHHVKTVRVSDGNTALKIEYCGDISFSEDGSSITAISPLGYIKYSNNGQRLYAECDEDGVIRYKLYDGSRRLHLTDPAAPAFMSHAVKLVEEHYYR